MVLPALHRQRPHQLRASPPRSPHRPRRVDRQLLVPRNRPVPRRYSSHRRPWNSRTNPPVPRPRDEPRPRPHRRRCNSCRTLRHAAGLPHRRGHHRRARLTSHAWRRRPRPLSLARKPHRHLITLTILPHRERLRTHHLRFSWWHLWLLCRLVCRLIQTMSKSLQAPPDDTPVQRYNPSTHLLDK